MPLPLSQHLSISRRTWLQFGTTAACASLWPLACGAAESPESAAPHLRLFACSNYLAHPERIGIGMQRLQSAGFVVDNTAALYRRHQRFAGTDAERAADLQDVALGRASLPALLLGVRGGYGAIRLLPLVDWRRLGHRMREAGTLLMGYSDVCAVQLALLAQGNMGSLAGPMFSSEFGSLNPSLYTLRHFVETSTSPSCEVRVAMQPPPTGRVVRVEGRFWGGNLSVLASLVGSPWMPDVQGGILFLEDVGEQPYRLERMLQTLYLAGVFRRQQAIVLGTFRLGSVHDLYDESYDFDSVIATLRQLTGLPVFTGFPFGHIHDKVTMPLGFPARIEGTESGYRVVFSGYPTLDARRLHLHALLDSATEVDGSPARATWPSPPGPETGPSSTSEE